MAAPRVIDGDGHIFEDMAAIAKHIRDYYRANWRFNPDSMFPPLSSNIPPFADIKSPFFGSFLCVFRD